MADQTRWKWQQIVTAPENEAIFAPYRRAAGEPRTMFEAIGEKLGSPREDERAHAFSAFYLAAPELAEILYERESRYAGYRSGSGEGPRLLNQGMDIVTKLYIELVKERGFKADAKHGTDPRPYVRRTMKNWQIDEARKRNGKSPLSLDAIVEDGAGSLLSTLPDLTDSPEAEAVEPLILEEMRRELSAWASLDEDEVALFEAFCANDWSLERAAAELGIPSPAAGRKRAERLRAKLLNTRDAILVSILEMLSSDGQLPLSVLEDLGWEARLKTALRPGPGVELGPYWICPLTRSFSGGVSNLYFYSGPTYSNIRDRGEREMAEDLARLSIDWSLFKHGSLESVRLPMTPCGVSPLDELLVETDKKGRGARVLSLVRPTGAAHREFTRIGGYFDPRPRFEQEQLMHQITAFEEAGRILHEEPLSNRSPWYRDALIVDMANYEHLTNPHYTVGDETSEAMERLFDRFHARLDEDRRKVIARMQRRFFGGAPEGEASC